jgi:hypothetical protein
MYRSKEYPDLDNDKLDVGARKFVRSPPPGFWSPLFARELVIDEATRKSTALVLYYKD